jgi:lysyl-tRNA synthetase class I
LLHIGKIAKKNEKMKNTAKNELKLRCRHAKKWLEKVKEAEKFLCFYGKKVLVEHTEDEKRKESIVTYAYALTPTVQQANYASFYKIKYQQEASSKHLQGKARTALDHSNKQVRVRIRARFIRKNMSEP